MSSFAIPHLRAPRKKDFAEAVTCAVDDALPPEVCPDACSRLFSHGRKTPLSILFLHGLTNAPTQFLQLAEKAHAAGHNVYVPRMPYHGYSDTLTNDISHLTLEKYAEWVSDALDVAAALGERLVVAGLSVNGVTAAWIAMHRPDVARAVLIAPFFVPVHIPRMLGGLLGDVFTMLPNFSIWWDFSLREKFPLPQHAYPKFQTRTAGRFLRLGRAVLAEARTRAPLCKDIVLVGTEADTTINVSVAKRFAANLARWPGVNVRQTWFHLAENIHHDFIDPRQTWQRTEYTDPVVLKALFAPAM